MIAVPAVTGRPTPVETAQPVDVAASASSTGDAVETVFVRVDATPSMWLFR